MLFILSVGVVRAQSPQVAVLDFKTENGGNGGEDWTVGLADFVELALQKQNVPTLERRQIRLVLGERELQAGGMFSAADLRKRGLPPVNYFVSGSVRRLAGGEFELTVSLTRADNATLESSFTRRGVYPAEWLPAIDSIAKEMGARLQSPAQPSSARSEFDSLTWLPEAALPFFKGLEYYARGDLPLAAGWFRTAAAKDPRFDQARMWEARALRQFGFPELAEFALAAAGKKTQVARTITATLPVVAVIAPDSIPVAGRAAFVNVLARSGRFEMFEPQAIGATAREIDLQLSGQMAAPLNERSVWLVVDSMVFVEAAGGKLRARQSDLLSGRTLREVAVSTTGSDDDFVRLARELLKASVKEETTSRQPLAQRDAEEPKEGDRPEVVFGKVLRLAKAHPDQARPWIGLCDFYGEWSARMMLLDRAIATIEANPTQSEASFWLASALWRKRVMLRRAYFYPDSTGYQQNALTNDFALLLKLFPESKHAHSIGEWTHKAGIYIYSHPTNRAYLNSAYGGGGMKPVWIVEERPTADVSESVWLARLKQNRERGENAKAWMQSNWRVPPLSPDAKREVDRINAELLELSRREQEQFKAFESAIERGDNQQAMELGRGLLRCLFRTQRLAVIEKCAALVKAANGCEAQVSFLIAQLERYASDFNFDPVTGAPRTETVDYRWDANTDRPSSWANLSVDSTCSSVLAGLVENGTVCGDLELTARVYETLQSNLALAEATRLTAMFDLARVRYNQGRAFEAVELLQALLMQTDGADVPQARGGSQISVGLESAAFALLKKIRLFADPEMDFADCCGELPRAPLPKPDNLDEMNRWFDELWSLVRGGVGGSNQPIKEQLIQRRAEVLPAMLYNLQRQERAQQLVMFAGKMGTNAMETLPFVVQYVCWADAHPGSVYCNALAALCGFGKSAGCAMPVLILASEDSDYLFNVKAALAKVGTAPPAAMPYLARLLYHKSNTVAEKAAKAMVATAGLSGSEYEGKSGEELILAVRSWWEQTGSTR